MSISEYSYTLPVELIAQEPLPNRAAARMMIVDRGRATFSESWFANFPELLRSGDVLVLNNTRVFPARLFGMTETGARIEILLVAEISGSRWEALARPAKRIKARRAVRFSDDLWARITEKLDDGRVVVDFDTSQNFFEILERVGRTPLPPYIKRPPGGEDLDRERYQTVYSRSRGAIAAPTAGLHFTPTILAAIGERGVQIVEITLHVGYGTFEPVRVDDVARHTVLPERYEIDDAAAAALNMAIKERRRIIAVGTTTTRALETNIYRYDEFRSESTLADLTIRPGHSFRAVNALLTNFHLPNSSLLILVSTFGGRELIMNSYVHAVAAGYRFYSYGDCMFIV